jgi:hypothetical protein
VPNPTRVPDRARRIEPFLAVVVFLSAQRVGNLVKDCLLCVVERTQNREVNRYRDLFFVVMTRARPTSSVIPTERPVVLETRKVLRNTSFGESLNFGQIDHASTISIG